MPENTYWSNRRKQLEAMGLPTDTSKSLIETGRNPTEYQRQQRLKRERERAPRRGSPTQHSQAPTAARLVPVQAPPVVRPPQKAVMMPQSGESYLGHDHQRGQHREGDQITHNGNTYVLQGSRWHLVEKPAQQQSKPQGQPDKAPVYGGKVIEVNHPRLGRFHVTTDDQGRILEAPDIVKRAGIKRVEYRAGSVSKGRVVSDARQQPPKKQPEPNPEPKPEPKRTDPLFDTNTGKPIGVKPGASVPDTSKMEILPMGAAIQGYMQKPNALAFERLQDAVMHHKPDVGDAKAWLSQVMTQGHSGSLDASLLKGVDLSDLPSELDGLREADRKLTADDFDAEKIREKLREEERKAIRKAGPRSNSNLHKRLSEITEDPDEIAYLADELKQEHKRIMDDWHAKEDAFQQLFGKVQGTDKQLGSDTRAAFARAIRAGKDVSTVPGFDVLVDQYRNNPQWSSQLADAFGSFESDDPESQVAEILRKERSLRQPKITDDDVVESMLSRIGWYDQDFDTDEFDEGESYDDFTERMEEEFGQFSESSV